MWFMENEENPSGTKKPIEIVWGNKLAIIIALAGTLILGIFPHLFFNLMNIK